MIRDAIADLVEGNDLTEEEAAGCMQQIMAAEATPAQFGAFVVALRLKGETVDEIVGMARVMREHALHVEVAGPLLDTCGTGGTGISAFNVSTAAAFVAAGAGVRVAKHGNRAMTSACGSADVLEALGGKIDLAPDGVRDCVDQTGFGFMFAQAFHPAMKFAGGLRREIGVRTVFNILGPLTNPAGAEAQVLGTGNVALAATMAKVLLRLGTKHAFVVSAEDGLDELSVSTPTRMFEVVDGAVIESTLRSSDAGIPEHALDEVRGGTAEENAAAMRRVLSGESGSLRDFTLLNAAAGLVAAGRAVELLDGVAIAAESIDSGAALGKLDAWVRVSNGG